MLCSFRLEVLPHLRCLKPGPYETHWQFPAQLRDNGIALYRLGPFAILFSLTVMSTPRQSWTMSKFNPENGAALRAERAKNQRVVLRTDLVAAGVLFV